MIIKNDGATLQRFDALHQRMAARVVIDIEVGIDEMHITGQIGGGDDPGGNSTGGDAFWWIDGIDLNKITTAAKELQLVQQALANCILVDKVEVYKADAHIGFEFALKEKEI